MVKLTRNQLQTLVNMEGRQNIFPMQKWEILVHTRVYLRGHETSSRVEFILGAGSQNPRWPPKTSYTFLIFSIFWRSELKYKKSTLRRNNFIMIYLNEMNLIFNMIEIRQHFYIKSPYVYFSVDVVLSYGNPKKWIPYYIMAFSKQKYA